MPHVFDLIGTFFGVVGGVMGLDSSVIGSVQAAPNGLSIALWILLVGTVSDVIGNSPLLFINRMRPGRLTAAFGIETVLSLVRLAIWILGLWIALVITNRPVTLANVVLVIGIGYAPMVWSFLVIIPTAGPLIGRVLTAWTLVTIIASIAVATNTSPWAALPSVAVAALVIVALRRSSDKVSMALLGGLSRRLVGVDLMQRTRAMDPALAMAGRNGRSADGRV
jgi:hypothetical protein